MSMNKDNSHSWVRISHGSNKCVMNLNNNEQEIPEVQLEEYAFKLDAKDFACRSKTKAKPQRREPAGSSPRIVLLGKELGPMLNQGNIQSLARVGTPDSLWSVNKLARSITKWTKACDKRLSRLISYIHHTCEFKQHCHVGNTAQHCRLGLFQDSDFAGDLEDSKSTSGGTLCVFGSHTFVPISWMCKKQTSVSHSSTESEIISLDAGLRLDGILALDLWDLIVFVLGNTTQNHDRSGKPLFAVTHVTSQASNLKE